MVLHHIAVGLEHDGKRSVVPSDLKQIRRLSSLKPQGSARSRPSAGKEQCTRSSLPELGAEEGRIADLRDQKLLQFARIEMDHGCVRWMVGIGKAEEDPIVRPDCVHG